MAIRSPAEERGPWFCAPSAATSSPSGPHILPPHPQSMVNLSWLRSCRAQSGQCSSGHSQNSARAARPDPGHPNVLATKGRAWQAGPGGQEDFYGPHTVLDEEADFHLGQGGRALGQGPGTQPGQPSRLQGRAQVTKRWTCDVASSALQAANPWVPCPGSRGHPDVTSPIVI